MIASVRPHRPEGQGRGAEARQAVVSGWRDQRVQSCAVLPDGASAWGQLAELNAMTRGRHRTSTESRHLTAKATREALRPGGDSESIDSGRHFAPCPSVGQGLVSHYGQWQEGYLDILTWHETLTLQQRVDRGPFQSAFAVGHGESAAEAVERARLEWAIADTVFSQVKEQAVYALLSEGLSIREIAAKAAIPKSEVGRIARRLGRDGEQPGSHATLAPAGTNDEVRDRIRAAWGHQ